MGCAKRGATSAEAVCATKVEIITHPEIQTKIKCTTIRVAMVVPWFVFQAIERSIALHVLGHRNALQHHIRKDTARTDFKIHNSKQKHATHNISSCMSKP
jgi:hypothetical protein